MSARAVECVLAHSKVDGSARALLLVLAWRSWDDSGCWTASLSDIAALVGINRRNTRIAIAKARSQTELAGEVGTGRGHVSRYEVRCGLTGQLAVKCDGKRVGSDPVIPRKKVGTNAITQAERGSVPTERGSLLSVERAPKPSKQNDGKEKVLKEGVPSRARAREETASTPVLEIKVEADNAQGVGGL